MANTKISAMPLKATPVGTESIPIADAGLSKRIQVSTLQLVTAKDTSNGYVGKTLHKINSVNNAGTITSFIQNVNTVARTYTLQDRNGTLADDTDLALKAPLASPTFTGTVAGVTALKNATTEVSTAAATAPTSGQVLTATSSTTATWQTPAAGTVTTVSVVTANGVSGSVANASTTPAITITLGAITPTSVNGVTSTEIGYVGGVTSAIQTQLNAKAPLASPTFTGTVTLPTVILGATTLTVTGVELNYVSGVTSAIQTQLNTKSSISGTPVDNQLAVWTGAGTIEGDAALTFDTTTDTLSTVNIVTTGTIEVGHATDTTLSRVSAGRIAVEGVNIPSISSTDTLTNKRITPRVSTEVTNATPSVNSDNFDGHEITALNTNATFALTGTPTRGQLFCFEITDDGTPRTLTWPANIIDGAVSLPTTTVASTPLTIMLRWNVALSKFRCLAAA